MRRSKPAASVRRSISSRSLYIGLVTVFLFLSGIEYLIGRLPLAEAQVEMGEYEKAQLDTFKGTNQLLTTLATAVIGGTAGLLLKKGEAVAIDRSDTPRIISSVGFAALSIYFGHLANAQVLFMLHNKFFNIYYPSLWLSSQLQFVTFICAVVMLADTTYRRVTRENQEAK